MRHLKADGLRILQHVTPGEFLPHSVYSLVDNRLMLADFSAGNSQEEIALGVDL